MTDNRDVINWTGAVVGIGLIAIMAFVTWALVFVTVPTENQTSLVQLVGNLTGLIGIVVGFYFGSSSTAKKQQDTIDTLARTAQTAGATLAQPDALVIPPGGSATATSTPDGTVIEPDGKP
jgi:hypothetical protein